MATVDLSIIVVNYNTAHLLHEMFNAVRKAIGNLSVQVIVIDNGSADGSVELLRTSYPEYQLIVGQNVGFGRANNKALPFVEGRYVLLLNTDAFVEPESLIKTVEYMDEHPATGVLGVKLVGRDGSLQPSARFFPTPWNVFLNNTGLNRVFSQVRMVDDMEWDHATVRPCDWVPGCYYLVRREVIDQVGLFDPLYFLYYEEVDHCFAAKKAGWEVTYFPGTTVVHIGGESAKSEGKLTTGGRQIGALQVESELIYFRKNHGIMSVFVNVFLTILAELINLAKRLIKGRRPFGFSGSFQQIALVLRLSFYTRMGRSPTR
jgi:hypothetical protein